MPGIKTLFTVELALLVGAMSLLPFPASTGQTLENRTVTVLLAVEQAGTRCTGCTRCTREKSCDSLKTIISDISTQLLRDFALQLEIEKCIPWKSNGQFSSLDDMFPYFFKTVSKKHADLVIGLTCRENLAGEGGISFYQESYILVQSTDDPRFFKKLLEHEIYHIFGASHVDQESSLMDRFLRGDRLDRLNREIILLNHDRDFKGVRFPLDSHRLEKAAAIYREMADLNEKLLPPSNLTPLEKQRSRKYLHGEKPLNRKQTDQVQKVFVRLEDVYLALAQLDIEMKNYSRAIRECETTLRIDPRRYEAYNLMGIAYRRSGDIEKAIANYNQALNINPAFQQIYYNLGIAYMKKGDVDKAQSLFQETISMNPNFADAWAGLGDLYFQNQQLEQARDSYLKYLAIDPGSGRVHNNLAVIYYYRKEFPLAHREMIEAEKSGFPVDEEFKKALKKALEAQDK